MARRIRVILLLLGVICLLAACGADVSGQYGGMADAGCFISLTLNRDGTLETDILGWPVGGTYTVRGRKLTIVLTALGHSETIEGSINGDTITFADATLKKGLTAPSYQDVSGLLGLSGPTATPVPAATATPYVAPAGQPIQSPRAEADEKYKQAERLFALGHYDEAIALYDEAAVCLDVEERRAYAVACRDYVDLYFNWSYNTRYGSSSGVVEDGLVLEEYVGYGMEEVTIPYGVCGLSQMTFANENRDIVTVTLPDTLRQIPTGCFRGCPNLTGISIPPSIEALALNGAGITELTVPATVKELLPNAFAGCTRLKTITFEGQPSLPSYGDAGLFLGCTSLESISVPGSFGVIPDEMFKDCTMLRTVEIGEGIRSIGVSAFENCSQLEAIRMPDSVTTVSRRAFRQCVRLQTVELSPGITGIGSSAFEQCEALKAISLTVAADTLPSDCFRGCSALEEVTLSDSLKAIDSYAFAGCTALRSVTLPRTVKAIAEDAFGGWRDPRILSAITFTITRGTYGHRFAEENGLSYVFAGDDAERVPLGTRFNLGQYNGVPLRWIVLAHAGDRELALCIRPVAHMAYHPDGGAPAYSDSAICAWLEGTFLQTSFTAEERQRIAGIQLLPAGYYNAMIRGGDLEKNVLTYVSKDQKWWLQDSGCNGYAWYASGYYSEANDNRVTEAYDIRPCLILAPGDIPE